MAEPTRKFTKINQGLLNKYDQDFYRRLNDVYIDTIAVVRFLDLASNGSNKKLIEEMPENLKVPSHGGRASIRRSQEQILEIFRIAASTGQWEKSLTFAISLTEDQVSGYIKLILRAKPAMLLTSIRGNEGSINIPLADIIRIGAEKVIEERVQARAKSAIFASPADYTKYLAALLQYQIPKEIVNPYIEMKARRDVIIHARGIVDDQYVEKTKDIAGAAQLSEHIVINRKYFEESMRGIKKFASSLYKQIVKQYGDDADVQKVLIEHGV